MEESALEMAASESGYVATIPLTDMAPGTQRLWLHGLQRILLCRSHEGNVYAVLDVCPHAKQPLIGGSFDDASITCPKHGACFDIRSGKPLNSVTKRQLQTLPVRICAGVVEVGLTHDMPASTQATRAVCPHRFASPDTGQKG